MTTRSVDPLPAEKDALIRLVKGVVLAQGNDFIKEFLRDRGLRIGTTKSDFEQNLIGAIERGELQRQHIDFWLNEVEGWGSQHVYLFKVPTSMRRDPIWDDPKRIESKIASAGFKKQWNAQTSLEYPAAQTLTGVYFEQRVLRFVWHKGLGFWLRDKLKDRREEIDSDTYEFRAYRMRAERSVTRFEIRPKDGLAAIFLQIAVDEEEHETAVENVKSTVSRVWPFDDLEALSIGTAIKKLDARSLEKKDVTANSTRLSAAGAYVEFGATSARDGYQDFTPVRDVRKAVRAASFSGMNGNFMVGTTDVGGAKRQVRIQLYAGQKRIKLAAQMTATEVWNVLYLITE
jgi:hypothetical protein